MKTNIDEPCAGNLQARFFRGSCSNITQTRGVKLQLLPNKFSEEKREAFNKSFYELLENSFKNINEKDEKGETILVRQEVLREQLVKIQHKQSLANSLEQTTMLWEVTNVVKLVEWITQDATKVKVLSSEIFNSIEVDIFSTMEDSMRNNAKARYNSLYRDRRPCHVLKWNLSELGRSSAFLQRYAGTSQQRQELVEDVEEVGLIDSTQRQTDEVCKIGKRESSPFTQSH
ncbi:hypothetical protein [Wolbachia endosymbiont (group A) of Barypeithes pellucidus]|uniref:hypothetical protein n=1 Tax=Wolbachia endosymbiont (group A) of Barypeithes pellucidus TaxID=3139322 RepID=UPI003CCAF9A5